MRSGWDGIIIRPYFYHLSVSDNDIKMCEKLSKGWQKLRSAQISLGFCDYLVLANDTYLA